MVRIKPRGRYMAISVPIALHDEISKYVSKSSYNSIAEFVKDAVREKMRKELIYTEELASKMIKTDEPDVYYDPKTQSEYIMKKDNLEDKIDQILILLTKNKEKTKNNNTHGLS